MTRKKDQKVLHRIIMMAVVVLAISGWSFVMTLHGTGETGIVDKSLASEKESEEQAGDRGEELDTVALAGAVKEKVEFDTELQKLEPSVTDSMIVAAAEDTKIELYMGEGTSADELLVVTVADEKKIDDEIKNVQKHLTDMQQSFQDYLPKEAKKINDAVILQSRNYIVACVTSDADTAREVLSEQLK